MIGGRILRAAISLVVVLMASATAAQEAFRVSSHGAWGVFADGSGDNRLCWIAANAELGALPSSPGTATPPERILVLFTAHKDELSLELRGGQEPDSAHISAGGEAFDLFFRDGWGWLRDNRSGQALKALLVDRTTAYVKIGDAGYSLSLDGFVPALSDAEGRCR